MSEETRLINNLSESQIIKIWQHQLLNGAELVTEGGEPIEIIYPGRINDERGADFRDAVVAINRRLIKGDVEVHVRSINSPIRRLLGMSYLLLRYRKEGLFKGLVGLIKEVSADRGCYRLEKGLMVTTNGYCAGHFDFGLVSRVGSPTLIGRGRAADIVVNVLLPFAFAWSEFTSQPELGEEAVGLYRCYPRLTENSVERHMTDQLGLNRGMVNSAQRQQGLIHIYNNLCTQGRCNDCWLSQLKAGNYV